MRQHPAIAPRAERQCRQRTGGDSAADTRCSAPERSRAAQDRVTRVGRYCRLFQDAVRESARLFGIPNGDRERTKCHCTFSYGKNIVMADPGVYEVFGLVPNPFSVESCWFEPKAYSSPAECGVLDCFHGYRSLFWWPLTGELAALRALWPRAGVNVVAAPGALVGMALA